MPEPAERPVSPDSQRTPTQLQRRWRHDARLVVLLLASVAAVLILPFLLQRRAPPSGDATEQLVASLDRTSGVLPSSWMAHPWSATRVPAASLGRAARSVRLGVLGVDLELLLAGEDSLAAAAAGQMAMLLAEMPASAPTARRDSAFFGSRVLRLTSRRLARIPDLASELSAALRDASVVPESPAAWQGLERRVALLELAPTRSISENRWSDRGGTRRMRR